MVNNREPWEFLIHCFDYDNGTRGERYLIDDNTSKEVATTDSIETGRRIVACVNACRGIPTKTLELDVVNASMCEFLGVKEWEKDE